VWRLSELYDTIPPCSPIAASLGSFPCIRSAPWGAATWLGEAKVP